MTVGDFEPCRTCGAMYDLNGDGWDGECGDCADRRVNDDLTDAEINDRLPKELRQ